ncbi:MAG TPA: carboxypeptidase regulatory-like domain-containing protein [Dongiaceae bacterium]|nr:carboxypeptidase regulatory-like domain-containing protein [Dongiaceae bacterium]
MATDDRERQFELALAKQLRDVPDKACPDAEVLSAYHERTLSLDEMAKWKDHIVGCERCRETLALLEQTDSVDADIWQEQNAVPQVEDQATMTTMMRATAAKIKLPEPQSLKTVAVVPPAAQAKRSARARWKWIAPIGAVAAGIIVWVGAVEIQKQRDLAAQKTVEMAQNRQGDAAGSITPLETPRPGAEPKPSESPAAGRLRDESEALRAATPAPRVPEGQASPGRNARGAVPGRTQELDKKKDATANTGFGSGNGVGAAPAAAPSAPSADAYEQRRSDASMVAKESGVSAGAAANAPTSRANPAPAPPAEKAREAMAHKQAAGAKAGSLSTITGEVLDPSGAAIGGAVVTVNGTVSGSAKTVVADGTGKFAVKDLPSDQYTVVAAHSGFEKSEQTVTLAPERNEQLNIQLKLGAATQAVEVTGAAPRDLNTTSTDLSANATSATMMRKLPSNGREFSQLVQLAASDPRYIVAPDEKVAWRVGDAGKVERSTDQGKTWKAQSSGVSADLRAGSATSEKVCWLIGKSGTILVTTDGGKHWKVVTSPISDDLGGIHASDTQHATIWDISNRKSFQTSDGGATWTPAANE